MIRYRYNHQVSPPAPFIHVSLQRPDGVTSVAAQPAQLDTAADMTVVPATLVEQMGLVQFSAVEVAAFGGIRRTVPSFLVNLRIHDQEPFVIEILSCADEPYVLLGRDVLNRLRVVLDGRESVLEIE